MEAGPGVAPGSRRRRSHGQHRPVVGKRPYSSAAERRLQPNSAWRVALAQADCNAEYSTVGGGPSGFGILEDDLGTSSVIYHRFDQGTMKFDTPPVTVVSGHGELDPALSQDGGGGIYATYLAGAGGAVDLSYSADGGHSFSTAVLNPNPAGGVDNLASAVNAAGQGWATWTDNGSVFARSFQAVDAISSAATSGGATSNGSTVTLNVTGSSCSHGISRSRRPASPRNPQNRHRASIGKPPSQRRAGREGI